MDPLIRAAIVAGERRQLRRPQPATTHVATPHAQAARAPVPGADAVEQMRRDVEQMRRDVEQQLAEGRRRLELEREAMRKEMAAEHAKALEQAAERGYDEGLRRGEAEGRQALDEQIARLRGLLDELRQARDGLLEGAEDTMVEIAFAALCRLAGTEAVARDVAVHAVRQASVDLRAGETLTVRVHPDDLAHLAGCVEQPGVVLAAGPTVDLGGCLIDGATGTLDARLETQVEQLRLALLRARAGRREGERA